MFLIVFLFFSVVMDLRTDHIRNEWILVGLAAGILSMLRDFSWEAAGNCVFGMLIPLILLWIPFRMHGIGAGDIKLFMVIGAFFGVADILSCIFFSFLLAAGVSLFRLFRLKQIRTSLGDCFRYFQQIILLKQIVPYPGRTNSGHRIHFSPGILLGMLAVLGVKVCRMKGFC